MLQIEVCWFPVDGVLKLFEAPRVKMIAVEIATDPLSVKF